MEGEDESDVVLSYAHDMLFSSAPHWLEFVTAEGLAVCEYVCRTFRMVRHVVQYSTQECNFA